MCISFHSLKSQNILISRSNQNMWLSLSSKDTQNYMDLHQQYGELEYSSESIDVQMKIYQEEI